MSVKKYVKKFNEICARLAQSVERTTLNRVVAGSIPAVGNFLVMST